MLVKFSKIFIAIITIFILNLEAKDNFFITSQEYGRMLYLEPRGVGCNLCHGKRGEGFLILNYKHKGKNLYLSAPNIQHLTFERFQKAIKGLRASIMPKYDLTDIEVRTLYSYLSSKDLNVTRR